MTVVTNATCQIGKCFEVVQHAASWLIDGPRQIFQDVDATADLLRLAQRVQAIFAPIIRILPLQRIAEGVRAITDFVNARNFVGGIYDIVTGNAAWEKPFSEHVPNLLKVASKLVFLIGDFGSLAEWLSSIRVLGAWVKDSTARLVTWGKEFNILGGIGDVTCAVGSLLSLGETIRLIVQEAITERYFKEGIFKTGLLTDHLLDIAYDVSGIAASILSNIPGVPAVLSLVSLAVGSTASLGRFFKKTYWIGS